MIKTTFLNFEQPIAELDSKIEELRFVQDDSAVDISEEIDRLSQKYNGTDYDPSAITSERVILKIKPLDKKVKQPE